ncbi:MAG: protein-glutamate O-methyltransferase CheR [Myxococcaceae bacterium]|nr:protein-glutamate O-methyltransferase CheR [Myxococcaceae bacterium]
MNPAEVEDIEVRLFLEAIHRRYGYDLRDYAPASIRRRVLLALAKSGHAHLGQLQHEVLTCPPFFAHLLEDLTVRVSEMFRDPSFYRAFRTQVVPVLRTYPLLKIWHTGCATGEEVYGTAIVLTEEGLYERAQIYATDLSPQALAQAKEGTYSSEVVKTFTENYQRGGGTGNFAAYYTEAYGGVAMNEALRRNVSFFQHNLVSDHAFGEMHVIFCRNVLIYFGNDLRERVLNTLSQSLCAGGFLCLGASERLGRLGESLAFSDFISEERIYRHEN